MKRHSLAAAIFWVSGFRRGAPAALQRGLASGGKPRTVPSTDGTGAWVKALTLMELMVALGISTLIITTLLLFFMTTRVSLARIEALIHAEEQARIALSRIGNELRLSSPLHVDIYDNSTASISGNNIRFQIPVGAYATDINLTSSQAIEWGSNAAAGNYFTYSLNGDKALIRAETDGFNIISSSILAQDVKALIFKRENLSSDQIIFQIDVQDTTLNLTRTIKSSVKLRN